MSRRATPSADNGVPTVMMYVSQEKLSSKRSAATSFLNLVTPASASGRPGLGEVRDALIGHLDQIGSLLDPDDGVAGFGEHGRQGKPHITESDDSDVVICWSSHHSSSS